MKRQEQEQFLSAIQKGEYAIRERFKSLEIGESYFKMNERRKGAVKKCFFNCFLTDEQFRNTSMDHITGEECSLSIPVMDFKVLSTLFLVLEKMYKNAPSLLKSETAIVRSPSFQPTSNSIGQNVVWLVASTVATRKPHSVTVGETGRVVCDKACVGWAQYSVCCHTIAAAEKRGILKSFWNGSKKLKKPVPPQKWPTSTCRKIAAKRKRRHKSEKAAQTVFEM